MSFCLRDFLTDPLLVGFCLHHLEMNILCLILTDIKRQCCVSLVPFVDNLWPQWYCYHAVALIILKLQHSVTCSIHEVTYSVKYNFY